MKIKTLLALLLCGLSIQVMASPLNPINELSIHSVQELKPCSKKKWGFCRNELGMRCFKGKGYSRCAEPGVP